MPNLYLTGKAGGQFGRQGKTIWSPPIQSAVAGDPDFTEAPIPAGVNPTKTLPSLAIYNGDALSRSYFVGSHTDNMVFTESYAMLRQGMIIPAHELISGVATNPSQIGVRLVAGPGITGNIIARLSLFDEVHNRRSSLTRQAPLLVASNQAIEYNNLPDRDVLDESATHWETFLSVDGALPALAERRQIGPTTIVVDTPSLSLGEVFLTTFTRFPRCRFNVIYHDRQVMAGDDRHPDRLYFSDLTFPERFGALFLRTRNGEPISGLAVVRDVLLVFSLRATYAVQGYTQDDLEMQILEPHIGCINHFGLKVIHGHLIIPSHLGFYLSTGSSFHFLSEQHQRTWRTEYRNNEEFYQSEAWSVDDPEENVYKFYVGNMSINTASFVDVGNPIEGLAKSYYWVLDYTTLIKELGGQYEPPKLSFDLRSRVDCWANLLSNPGSGRGNVFTGSDDGFVRRENDRDNNDDDGDTGLTVKGVAVQMPFYVRTKHYFWGDPAGGPEDGWKIPEMWLYVENETNNWTASVFAGDLDAYRHSREDPVNIGQDIITGDWEVDVPASFETYAKGSIQFDSEKQSLHYVQPQVSGRGMTFSMLANSPTEVWFRGLAGNRIPGTVQRNPVKVADEPG